MPMMFSLKKLMLTKKNRLFLLAVAAGLLVLSGIIFAKSRNQPPLNIYTVGFGNINQELSFTGKVKPAEEVELSFEKGGRIEAVLASVGKKVGAGETLARLDSSVAFAEVEKAEANLKTEEVKLEELKRGSRPEEIRIAEAKLDSAKINVDEAKKSLVDKINDAYTKSDDSVRGKTDQFFTDPRTQTPRLNLFPVESQLKSDLEYFRQVIENMLKSWSSSLTILNDGSDLISYSNKAKENLNTVKSFLDKAALAVNSMTTNSNFPQTTIDSYKADVSSARTNINTAIANLSTADEKYRTSESSLSLAEREYELIKAGSSQEAIQVQEARVLQAKAGLSSARAEFEKTVLRSPIPGIVTKKNISPGEISSLGQAAFSVISDSGLEIEANITEIDIAKIKVGTKAEITLDAYGQDEKFFVMVSQIEPAETVVEGVSTYKTKFIFEQKDERIKSGMTANIEISLELKNNVLVVPQKAVISRDSSKFVMVFDSRKGVERQVKTGLRSSDGFVEILEGLETGDQVVLP